MYRLPSNRKKSANMLYEYYKYRVGCDDRSNANDHGEVPVNQNWEIIRVHVDVIFNPVQHRASCRIDDV